MADMPHKPGVYSITCSETGKMYIGSAVDLKKRWYAHRTTLNRGISPCVILQHAWSKYGQEAFIFAVLELLEDAEILSKKELRLLLRDREQHYIDLLDPYYNASRIALSSFHDPEVQKRVAEINKEIVKRPERNRKISEANTGRKHTPEAIERMREAQLGKHHSPETRTKISEVQKGRVLSPEVRQRHSESMKGNPKARYPKSEEHKAKLREAIKRKNEDPEYRAMMAERYKTRKPPSQPRSQESRERSRQARSTAWERQREEGYTGPERDPNTGQYKKKQSS